MNFKSLLFCLGGLWFCACQPVSNTSKINVSQQIKLTDDIGRAIVLDAHPKKVMALAPSMTEYLALICDKKQVVARTQNCDFPLWVQTLPEIINYPHLDIELVLQIKPDLIITHKGMTPEADLIKLAEFGIPTYVFLIDSLDKISRSAKKIGLITGNSERGIFVSDSLRKIRLQVTNMITNNRTALGLISTQPLFVFGKGSLVNEMMTEVGLINCVDSSFISAYPQLDEEYLLRKNPMILFAPSSISWQDFFSQHPNLKELNAYKENQLYLIPKNIVSRQGPRILFGLQELNKLNQAVLSI